MTTFHVGGSASRYFAPERGTLNLRIGVSSLNKLQAHETGAQAHNRILQKGRAFKDSGAATWVESTAPQSYSYQEKWLPDGENAEPQSRTRHNFNSTVSVKFQDFDALFLWLSELAEEEFVSYSVSWDLTEVKKKELAKLVRAEAVVNARELAEDYARGDNLGGGGSGFLKLMSVTDVEDMPGRAMVGSFARSAAAKQVPTVADFAPQDIEVSAHVAAVFEL